MSQYFTVNGQTEQECLEFPFEAVRTSLMTECFLAERSIPIDLRKRTRFLLTLYAEA